MACNCGTQEEINKLYKAYGDKMALARENKGFWNKIKYGFYGFLTILSWVIVFPIMLVYVLGVAFWEENPRINVQSINLLKIFHINA